ncbi:hypothetical protein IWQ56_003260, partial [Coemansia nantahalensis]
QKADDETKREMQRIVQRYHDDIGNDAIDVLAPPGNSARSEDSDTDGEGDDSEEPSLAERLGGIDLAGELDDTTVGAIWHRLTEEERAGFVDLLAGHGVESIVPPWQPWCLAYVYTMRHLNGETRGRNLAAAFTSLEQVAPLLSQSTADVYQSAHEALIVGFSGINDALDGKAKCALLDDILAIYAEPLHVAAMVSDMYRIATDILGAGASVAHSLKKAPVKRAERRLYFLASVIKQMQRDADPWRFMAMDVAMLRQRYASDIQTLERDMPRAPAQVDDAGAVAGGASTGPRIQPL